MLMFGDGYLWFGSVYRLWVYLTIHFNIFPVSWEILKVQFTKSVHPLPLPLWSLATKVFTFMDIQVTVNPQRASQVAQW